MRVEELDYVLPPGLIATEPAEPRESCRLMVVHRATSRIEDRRFTDLGEYLCPRDLLVLNSARVMPARCRVRMEEKHGRTLEMFVLNPHMSGQAEVLLNPSRKVWEGMCLWSAKGGRPLRVGRHLGKGCWGVTLGEGGNWKEFMEVEGEMPLPPYILKSRGEKEVRPQDADWYQTAYADREGAVASPTAGLHFSEAMLRSLEAQGVGMARLFLKVGMGTFQPVKTERLEDHPMHVEEYEVGEDVVGKYREVRGRGGRIVAVGTTSVRAMESLDGTADTPFAGHGETRLLILPPHKFQRVDLLLTNFHLPRSTLLALVYAFGGTDLIRKAYAQAVERGYRFYSYGDAMLIV